MSGSFERATPEAAVSESDRSPAKARSSGTIVQRKLVVGSHDDAAEREADTVADEVLRSLAGTATPEIGRIAAGGRVSRSTIHRSPAELLTRTGARGRVARSAVVGPDGGQLDSGTSDAIDRARSSGAPLDTRVRRRMEGAFGADFSSVRMHVGAESDALNEQISAKAFTTGSDVFVRRDHYAPGTSEGDHLIAHELAHTLQQGGATVAREMEEESTESEGSDTDVDDNAVDEAAETEAEAEEETEAEEAAETETAEESIEFTLAPVETEQPHESMGAGMGREDAARSEVRRRAAPTTSSAEGSSTFEIVPMLDFGASTTETSFGSISGIRDKVNTSGVKLTTETNGNHAAGAFGEMLPTYTFTNIDGVAKKGKVFVSADLKGTYSWGTDSGGVTDVPSGTDGVVTKDNWQDIVDDLTPVLEEKCWRAPRSTYWSEAICARHEKYHASDETKWAKKKAKGVVATYFKKNPIELTEDERKDPAVVKRKTEEAMAEALQALDAASWNFYTGGASTYCTRAGEIRAFGDGKKPYLKLVSDVKKQGKKLEKAAKASATTGS